MFTKANVEIVSTLNDQAIELIDLNNDNLAGVGGGTGTDMPFIGGT